MLRPQSPCRRSKVRESQDQNLPQRLLRQWLGNDRPIEGNCMKQFLETKGYGQSKFSAKAFPICEFIKKSWIGWSEVVGKMLFRISRGKKSQFSKILSSYRPDQPIQLFLMNHRMKARTELSVTAGLRKLLLQFLDVRSFKPLASVAEEDSFSNLGLLRKRTSGATTFLENHTGFYEK